MFQATSPLRPNRIPGTLDLEISDPVLLLNEIARRYETTERVLMEYVDNALDDAEVLYRENGNGYPYPINIEITLNFDAGEVTIKDNGRGMSRQLLERVVKNIGESHKREVAWVNGRFGFGVQAFRAAAGAIQFYTKQRNSSAHVLELQREQQHGIKEAKRLDDAFPTDSGTGTLVTITSFDPDWASFSVESVKAEIERHFERLTARPDLTITVRAAGQPAERCVPFDYSQLAGEAIRQTLVVEYKGESYPIEVHLMVTREKVARRAASFFARGRRINEAAQIKSFMRKSKYKTGLWGHPNLLGYIEVGEIVQPAITRDDFNRTKGRQACYETILTLEPTLNKLLRQVNHAGKDKTLVSLEKAVNRAVVAAPPPASADAAAGPTAPAGASAAAPVQPSGNPEPIDLPAIRFVAALPGSVGWQERAARQEGIIYINTEHPDFKARLAYNRHGAPKITDRLNGYLAGILSLYYPANSNPKDLPAILETQLDTIIKLEAALHQQRSKPGQKLMKK